jgi:hypothetical protein
VVDDEDGVDDAEIIGDSFGFFIGIGDEGVSGCERRADKSLDDDGDEIIRFLVPPLNIAFTSSHA